MHIVPDIINNDVNQTFDSYYSRVFEPYDTSYPKETKAMKKKKNGEWITSDIKACIKKKSKLYGLFVRGRIVKQDYTYYAYKLTTLLRKAKKLNFYKLFLNVGCDSAQVWFHTNRLLGNCSHPNMDKLRVESTVLTGREMVNYANEYFVDIANNLTKDILSQPYNFYTLSNPHTFLLAPADEHEVASIVKKLKNKANSIVDISAKTLKNNSCVFSPHLAFLYNYSIEKRCFPQKLKIARIVPAHKSGSKDLIDNYWPISNLSVFSKVFETLTFSRMGSFVDKYGLLGESQFGFRWGKNITLAALKLTTSVLNAYHLRYFSACFFLDLRKVFDTIDHSILLRKLEHIGFRGHPNEYIESYIRDRRQYLQIGDMKSDELLISKGVPQGSVLGPLLFCLYIDDIV